MSNSWIGGSGERVELSNATAEYLEIFHNRQRRHSAKASPAGFETRQQTTTVA
jgi:hypothetical protein